MYTSFLRFRFNPTDELTRKEEDDANDEGCTREGGATSGHSNRQKGWAANCANRSLEGHTGQLEITLFAGRAHNAL